MIKEIPGTYCTINTDSIIINTRTGEIVKPYINKVTGYYYVTIYNKAKKRAERFAVHRLMRNLFMLPTKPTTADKWEIGHIDENKANNQLSNLYWTTHKDNCSYGNRNTKISNSLKGRIARTDIIQRVECVETGIIYRSITDCAQRLGIAKSAISKQFKTKGEYYNINKNIHIIKV